jgi:hypothetical protein
MGRNQVRRSNSIQARRIWKFCAVVLVLAIFSLVFVFLQIRNIKLADEVHRYEVSLDDYNKRNNLLGLDIDRGTKPRVLQRKIEQFHLQMVSVAELPRVEAFISPKMPVDYQAYVQKEDRP